nr:hypothetical protein [uncultured Rhodopila sp.]
MVLMTPEDLSVRRLEAAVAATGIDFIGIGAGKQGSSGQAARHRVQSNQRWNAPEMSGH